MIFLKIIKDDLTILNLIREFNNKNENLLITYFNQNCFNIYNKNKKYREILEKHFHIYLDGMGIYLALKFLGYGYVKKFNATDLNTKIIKYLIKTKKNVYMVGGNFSKLQILNATKKGLKVIYYRNGFFNNNEIPYIISDIKNKNPDIILIGMGVPRQEMFALKLIKYINGKTIICVGNYFEFYLGTIKRIPKPLRDKGIEWCYRIYTEPRRLWDRYFYGIPIYILSIIRLKINV